MPDNLREIDLAPRFRDLSGEISAPRTRAEDGDNSEGARTFDVIWSTGARVLTYVRGIGPVQEELDMSPGAIRMGRFASGRSPVLDKHMGYSSRDILGRVASAVLVEGQGRGTIVMSDDDDTKTILQKVRNGTLRNTSVGYRVFQYAPVDLTAEPPIYRAVDWEPFELSLCPIGQDAGAMIRSEGATGAGIELNKCIIVSQRAEAAAHNQEVTNMTPEQIAAAAAAAAEQTRAAAAAAAATAAAAPAAVDQTRAVPAAQLDLDQVRREAVEGERRRSTGIRERVRSVGLPDAFAEGLVTRGVMLDHVGDAIVNELAARGARPATPSGATVGHDNNDPVELQRAMVDALAARGTAHLPSASRIQPEGRAREFMQHSVLEIFADYARSRGHNISPRHSKAVLWDELVRLRSLSTSDFPILLADASNKILMKAYSLANNTYRMVAARKTFSDFKPHNFLRAGDFPNLLQVGETGEFKYGVMGEAKQAVTLATFGRIMRLSRRVIINDDMAAFADLPAKAGRRISDFENALGWAQIEGSDGPVITETTRALFHTTDGTKAGAGAAISIATVGAGRAAMMKQTSIGTGAGEKLKLNVAPRYLVTSPDKFTEAEQFCNVNIVAVQDSAANPFKGKLIPVGDANLTGNPWYLFADPSELETLIYGYLEGMEGPRMVAEEGFTTDGVDLKVALDTAVGAIDFRGAYKNPGA
jgi:hypothetical protein